MSISYLTSEQRELLTPGQIGKLPYTDFRYLSAEGVDHLSPAQVATIPNSNWFATMSRRSSGLARRRPGPGARYVQGEHQLPDE
ncbi:MAG: hypothetical protein IPM13_05190 [Phycisphaerales bacterium]|nr:hypothetical protein [Phycisphaerales bacterium]